MQALILLDFMLSLTPKAKARLSNLTNKSVLYGFVLNDEDVSFFFSFTSQSLWNRNLTSCRQNGLPI